MPPSVRPTQRPGSKSAFRLFIIHLGRCKESAIRLRDALADRDVAGHVAHARFQRTPKWQENTLDRLRASDGVVALLHKGFYESEWTEQEVGAALGRGLLVIPITFGEAPRGFMSQCETLQGKGQSYDKLADAVVRILKGHPLTRSKMAAALAARVVASQVYKQAVGTGKPVEKAE